MSEPALENTDAVRRRRHGVNVPDGERAANTVVGAAVLLYGVRRRGAFGWIAAALGATLVARGVIGRCPIYRSRALVVGGGIEVQRSIVVARERREVFAMLRQLRNLPRFVTGLESVEELEDLSHWVATAGGDRLEWLCELVDERRDRRLRWRAIPGGDIAHEGCFELDDAPDGRGTLITLTLRFLPPLAPRSPWKAFLRSVSSHQLAADLLRLRALLDSGEIATSVRRRGRLTEAEAVTPTRVARGSEPPPLSIAIIDLTPAES